MKEQNNRKEQILERLKKIECLKAIERQIFNTNELPNELCLNNKEFAKLMGISELTALFMRRKGLINHIKFNSKNYLKISDIYTFLDTF